jgi:hypothetical protein
MLFATLQNSVVTEKENDNKKTDFSGKNERGGAIEPPSLQAAGRGPGGPAMCQNR